MEQKDCPTHEDMSRGSHENIKEQGTHTHAAMGSVVLRIGLTVCVGLSVWVMGSSWYASRVSVRGEGLKNMGVESMTGSSTVRDSARLAPLEQPDFSSARPPLTALISNFDTLPMQIEAQAVLVADLTTHVELFEKNPDKVWPIASITKLLTASAAEELATSTSMVTITDHALTVEGVAGNLEAGEQFKLHDLIQLMLFVSSNRAAEAIGDAFSPNLLPKIQAIIDGLGLTHTHIGEVTGLSPQNVSTPRELKSIVEYVYEVHPELLRMTIPKEIIVDSSLKTHKLINIDYLSLHPDLGFLGGKTGTIDQSGENIVAVFAYHNHQIAVILLGSNDRFNEVMHLLEWVKRAYIFR
ncbi:MAG: D-alanyl-D-alanine carboxypeptidase [Patescibacteria group bacterium]|nr:D-alanyl-D-alanine carboxypeptidase [Patescibacteria group bacterium]MDE2438651.1 D-alanyl-D-alanine carboxypeptidase [Patescibacteria group bacterium]